jgi:hypothetical protein
METIMKSMFRYGLLLASATAFSAGVVVPALADDPRDWVTMNDPRADGRLEKRIEVTPAQTQAKEDVVAATQRLPAPAADQMPAAGDEPTSNAIAQPVATPKPVPMRSASNDITIPKAMRSHIKSKTRRERDAEEREITDRLNEQSLQNTNRF